MEGRDEALIRPGTCDDPNTDIRRLIAEAQDMAEYARRALDSLARPMPAASGGVTRTPSGTGRPVRHRSG